MYRSHSYIVSIPPCAGLATVIAVGAAALFPHVTLAQESGPAKPYVPRHVLVRFKPSASTQSIENANQNVGVHRVLRDYHRFSGLKLVEVPEGKVEGVVAAFQQNPDVLYAEPDYIFHLLKFPDEAETATAHFEKQWGLRNRGQSIEGQTGIADSGNDAKRGSAPKWL